MNLSDTVLLLTRPAEDAERFAKQCQARLGAFGRVLISPLLRVVFLGPVPQDPDTSFIFTSVNGVRAYAQGGGGPGRQAFTVGERTGQAARDLGLRVQVLGPNADALVTALIAQAPRQPLLHITGVHQRGAVAERLTAAGLAVRRAVLYDQQAQPLSVAAHSAAAGQEPVIAPIFSPRSAALLRAELPAPGRNFHALALSPAVAEAWGPSLPVSGQPNADSMINAIAALLETLDASG